MKRQIEVDKDKAKELYIEGIRELEAHSKREYIDKNLEKGSSYPSVSFMKQRFNIDFDECRELAGIKAKTNTKWTREELEELIRELVEKYGYENLTHERIKEEVGVHLGTTIKRVCKITFTELKRYVEGKNK